MSLLWIDGFEKYGTVNASVNPTGLLHGKYSCVSPDDCEVVEGRYSGKALKIDYNLTQLTTPDLSPGSKTLIVGFNFKVLNGKELSLIDFRHPGAQGETIGYQQLTFRINSSGEIVVDRGNTAIITTNTANIQLDTWYAFEAKVYCDDSSGTCNVYLDHVEVGSFSGDTRHRNSEAGAFDRYSRVMFRTVESSNHLVVDDFYVFDNTGNTNNDVIGERFQVACLSPTSDASGNFSPSTGNDMYAVIDEDAQDANYISDDTSGNRAVFETTNLTANEATGTIKGVMLNCEARAYSRFAKVPKFITQNGSGGSLQDGSDIWAGYDSDVTSTKIMEEDPDGNSWSAATVNDFRLGVEIK